VLAWLVGLNANTVCPLNGYSFPTTTYKSNFVAIQYNKNRICIAPFYNIGNVAGALIPGVMDDSFIHLLYMKPTEYVITTLKIKTAYQLSAHWQLQGR